MKGKNKRGFTKIVEKIVGKDNAKNFLITSRLGSKGSSTFNMAYIHNGDPTVVARDVPISKIKKILEKIAKGKSLYNAVCEVEAEESARKSNNALD